LVFAKVREGAGHQTALCLNELPEWPPIYGSARSDSCGNTHMVVTGLPHAYMQQLLTTAAAIAISAASGQLC
jgi:hypothetical protein